VLGEQAQRSVEDFVTIQAAGSDHAGGAFTA